jgi:hypothetical protein
MELSVLFQQVPSDIATSRSPWTLFSVHFLPAPHHLRNGECPCFSTLDSFLRHSDSLFSDTGRPQEKSLSS